MVEDGSGREGISEQDKTLPLHELMSSDDYWAGAIAGNKTPFFRKVGDQLISNVISKEIEDLYRKIAERGAHVTELPQGKELTLVPGGLLKVVEDRRIEYKNKNPDNSADTPEVFDAQAQAMVDELFFLGKDVLFPVGADEKVFIKRRTLYLQEGLSGEQLIGVPSELLGKGNTDWRGVILQKGRVGEVTYLETKESVIKSRLVSAQNIRPNGLVLVRNPQVGRLRFDSA